MKRLTVRQKPLEVFIHCIIWLLVFGFPLFLTNHDNNINWGQYIRHCMVSLSYFILFYSNYLYLIPSYLFRNRISWFCMVNVMIVLLFSSCTFWEMDFLFLQSPHNHPSHHMHRPPRWIFYARDLIAMGSIIALSIAIRVSLQWRKTEEKLMDMQREKTEAELKNLKNQLNPHFLLNTLNNIYALISFDSHKAQNAVHELSKLLRYMLYENQSELVPLEKELEFIRNYVSLMRIRVVKTVEVSLKLDEGPNSLYISPLIFISLIENAFKHGISSADESFISISIQGHADGKVSCEIMNSYFPKSKDDKSGSGIGLEQVKRRLELFYPGRYEWNTHINEDGKSYTSSLTIQTQKL